MHSEQQPAEPLLSLSQLNLVYQSKPALRSITWTVRPGEQWACLGPNGAGKTSLANVISGVAARWSGEYHCSNLLRSQGIGYVCFERARALCNRDRKLDDAEFRADASDPGTTVESLILNGRAPDSDYQQWVQRLSMGHILNRGLRYISTGEMRKTLLVAAILARPALLILDSPLDGLDSSAQREMGSIIDELLTAEMTLLLLCRQVEDIPEGVSHLLVLDEGEVLACGLRAQVLQQTNVQSLMQPPLAPLADLPEPLARPYELPETEPLIAMRDVNVAYGDLQVLRAVNWTFERGMHCCVAGPNGCGKSTLLSLVTGDNHKAYGQDITLFGRPRGSGESIWEIKEKYGQIDTQLHLNFARGMSALEVVVSGFFDTVGLYDDWGDAQRDRADGWLAALGLATLRTNAFDNLSFGLQRMVLLARAMVKSPIILLLDEPTLGLDGHHRRLVLRAIDHIAAHCDTQVIFVSHAAGEMPACINQLLRFEPAEQGFDVIDEAR